MSNAKKFKMVVVALACPLWLTAIVIGAIAGTIWVGLQSGFIITTME